MAKATLSWRGVGHPAAAVICRALLAPATKRFAIEWAGGVTQFVADCREVVSAEAVVDDVRAGDGAQVLFSRADRFCAWRRPLGEVDLSGRVGCGYSSAAECPTQPGTGVTERHRDGAGGQAQALGE